MSLVSKLAPIALANTLTTSAGAIFYQPPCELQVNLQIYENRIETNIFVPLEQNAPIPYELHMTFANPNTPIRSDLSDFKISVPSPSSLYLLGMGLATIARKRR